MPPLHCEHDDAAADVHTAQLDEHAPTGAVRPVRLQYRPVGQASGALSCATGHTDPTGHVVGADAPAEQNVPALHVFSRGESEPDGQ